MLLTIELNSIHQNKIFMNKLFTMLLGLMLLSCSTTDSTKAPLELSPKKKFISIKERKRAPREQSAASVERESDKTTKIVGTPGPPAVERSPPLLF